MSATSTNSAATYAIEGRAPAIYADILDGHSRTESTTTETIELALIFVPTTERYQRGHAYWRGMSA